mgnify:CR=1 FL=1
MVDKNDKLAFTDDPAIQAIIPFELGNQFLNIRANNVLAGSIQTDAMEPEAGSATGHDYGKPLPFP